MAVAINGFVYFTMVYGHWKPGKWWILSSVVLWMIRRDDMRAGVQLAGYPYDSKEMPPMQSMAIIGHLFEYCENYRDISLTPLVPALLLCCVVPNLKCQIHFVPQIQRKPITACAGPPPPTCRGWVSPSSSSPGHGRHCNPTADPGKACTLLYLFHNLHISH